MINRIVYIITSGPVFLEVTFHLGQYGPVSLFCFTQYLKIISPEKGKILGGILAPEGKFSNFCYKFSEAVFGFSVKLAVKHHASVPLFIKERMGVFHVNSGLNGPTPMGNNRLCKISQADRVGLTGNDRGFRHDIAAGKLG